MTASVLEVEGLRVRLEGTGARADLVRGVSFGVGAGEVLGLIGESGSGKTVTTSAILRLLPDGIEMRADRLTFAGTDIQPLGEREFRTLRGVRLAMIFQDPTGAFNPAKSIGWHMRTVMSRAARKSPELQERVRRWRPAAIALLRDVGITRGAEVLGQYPHQLSGGMLQRALIALVLALQPDLIVADEPTTNLDNIVERQIIELFQTLRAQLDAAMIFITHDISIARLLCDRIAVMYAGQVIEVGNTQDILDRPCHPYTRGLIAASTELDERPERLTEMPGDGHMANVLQNQCAFAPRCAFARAECLESDPTMRRVSPSRSVRCVMYDER